jgi:hypothetical protein
MHTVKKLMNIRICPVSEIVNFSLLFLILYPYPLFNHSLKGIKIENLQFF